MNKIILSVFALALSFLFVAPNAAEANHSWGGYHWARTSNPFTVQLGDNVSATWDPYLSTSSADWTLSEVLNSPIVSGRTLPKQCRPTNGRVEVCNAKYGNNGWLGIAQIWASGSHITQGAVKLNDTYFNTARYNTPAWRNLVMCQEVGHTFGLDHQDENFSNLPMGTCMDYSNDPLPNQHPNQHDFDQLAAIYAHVDGFNTTLGQSSLGSANGDLNSRAEWGRQIKNNGHVAVYERALQNGNKVVTFVVWAEGEAHSH
jgi:hypothetical protein